jgi:4a-hydroxytetrahydrobiopterin dehydratase
MPATMRGNLAASMTLLSDAEIEERLATLGRWRQDEHGAIMRELELEDFAAAIAFVGRVAEVAEQLGHHPDILVHRYRRVRLTSSTHSEDGLTAADFELAARIDRLA